MAIEFGKGITLAGGFDLGAKAPLDSRVAVATLADRDAHVTGNRAYEGMLVYVEENKITYQYVADEEGNLSWKEFGFNLNDFQGQVIDNLESDDTTKALSAKQGKELKALIDAEAERAGEAEEANAAAIEALDTKVGEIPVDEEGASVADTVIAYVDKKVADEAAIARAAEQKNAEDIKAIADDYLVEADKTELQGNIDVVSGKVTTLIGEDADKSVRTIANEELAKQLIAEGAKESLDTLTEIAAWIQAHPDDAAAMNKAIDDLEALIGTIPEGVTATTIVAYIQEAIAVETAAREAAVNALDERLQIVEGKFEGEESVENKIGTAKQEAIDSAKEYADDLNTAMDGRMTQAEADIDALEADTHTHENKEELDKFVDGDKAKLDDASAKAHEHANKALLDTYTQTEEDLADAVAKKHAHENADVLDGITEEKVAAWDAAEANAKAHAEEKVNELANGTIADHTTEINSLDGRVDVLEEVSATHAKQADLEDEVTRATEAEGAINAKIGEVAEGKTVVQMIADAQTEATYDDTEVKTDIEAIETALAEGGATANAIKAAQDAADKAQGEVDALETLYAADKAVLEAKDAELVAADEAMAGRLDALEAVKHEEISPEEISSLFAKTE